MRYLLLFQAALLMVGVSALTDKPPVAPQANLASMPPPAGAGTQAKEPWKAFGDGEFAWRASGPLLAADKNAANPHVSIKDPTVVQHHGRWHLFATVRTESGKVDIEYLSFEDWQEAEKAPRHLLNLHDDYYCAPQVFFFTPHRRWYLVYQLADKNRKPPFGPFFSTTENLSDPASWSKPEPMMDNAPEKPKWLDFWVIFDADKGHLFYTSLDGRMWRCETKRSDFPGGWSTPQLALKADIFEASHTYKLKGMNRYLTIVEAQGKGRRYYKAYVADSLDGEWKGLADTIGKPFAGMENVRQDPAWTANISHGELIRAGVDEMMEIDPANVRFVFQGASDAEYRGNPYGQIPWRLGILEMVR
jgi:hypothetical protein